MTLEAYKRATDILEEKKALEKELQNLRMTMEFDFSSSNERYIAVSNKLFSLGQEFADL